MSRYWTDGTELYHYGIPGQKWGVRRWTNPDGTLNEAGKKRYRKQAYRQLRWDRSTAREKIRQSKPFQQMLKDKRVETIRKNQALHEKFREYDKKADEKWYDTAYKFAERDFPEYKDSYRDFGDYWDQYEWNYLDDTKYEMDKEWRKRNSEDFERTKEDIRLTDELMKNYYGADEASYTDLGKIISDLIKKS